MQMWIASMYTYRARQLIAFQLKQLMYCTCTSKTHKGQLKCVYADVTMHSCLPAGPALHGVEVIGGDEVAGQRRHALERHVHQRNARLHATTRPLRGDFGIQYLCAISIYNCIKQQQYTRTCPSSVSFSGRSGLPWRSTRFT